MTEFQEKNKTYRVFQKFLYTLLEATAERQMQLHGKDVF